MLKIDNELLFTMEVQKELKNGNTGRTKHFSQAHKEKQAWNRALPQSDILTATNLSFPFLTFFEEVLEGKPIAEEVGIVVERVLGKRQRLWDHDSTLRGAKEMIDSLVFHSILTDDSPKHVGWCVGKQDDSCKDEGPFVRIHFYKA